MRVPYYQVDAFTARAFGGNPAGVCLLQRWLPDVVLQAIAAENNLSETAFFVHQEGYYDLRWFTPLLEVDLCGHATLATAFVLFSELGHAGRSVRFKTRSGWVTAERRGEIVELDFPSRPPTPCPMPEELWRGLGRKPSGVLRARDYVAVFESTDDMTGLRPDMDILARLDALGVIVTAQGE